MSTRSAWSGGPAAFRLMFQAWSLRAKKASVHYPPGCLPAGFRLYRPVEWSLHTVCSERTRDCRCCHSSWCRENALDFHIQIAQWLTGSSSSQKHLWKTLKSRKMLDCLENRGPAALQIPGTSAIPCLSQSSSVGCAPDPFVQKPSGTSHAGAQQLRPCGCFW